MSLDLRAPKKKASLDIAAARNYVAELRRPVSRIAPRPMASLDGVRVNEHSFLHELKTRSPRDHLFRFFRKSQIYLRRTRRVIEHLMPAVGPRRMVYASLFGGVAFGVLSMAFLSHFLGGGVFASTDTDPLPIASQVAATSNEDEPMPSYTSDSDLFFEYFNDAEKEQYEDNVRQMVKGYPVEAMLPYIFQYDRLTAAFLVGIAKKESNWGKRVPVLNGADCFNYWGYRGIRRMMGTGGHTCFNSRKDAVDTVAKRLQTLINSEKLDTPAKMVVWKCGFSCSGQNRESVLKWISDVDMYFSQLNDE